MVYFSHSRIVAFENCKLRYKFRYIDKKIPGIEQCIEAFMGTMVHRALEKLYRDIMFERTPALEELLEWYNREWEREWNDNIIIVNKEYDKENYKKVGERCIRDYYKRHEPFNDSRTIGLEIKVKIPLDSEGKYIMTGIIDRLAYAGKGVYEIHDYKTTSTLPAKEFHDDRQLALYAIGVKSMYHDVRKVRLVWHFLAYDKETVMEKGEGELDKLKRETISLIEKIKNEKAFKPEKSKLCDWCEFRSMCPLWSHIVKVENLEPNEYLNDPGVKLANRYAELKTEREEFLKRIDREIEKVKEAIIKFSDKEKCDVIVGSDVQLRIWKAVVPKIPTKDEPQREMLEKQLRKMGKWEEVSTLDGFALSNIIKNEKWPKNIIEKLSRFVKTERIERIYLKTLNQDNSGQ